MQYSLRTQTTIDCGKSSFKSPFNHHSLQSSPCKQKHILQMLPKPPQIKTDDSNCINLLAKNFNQPAPNNVWVCDFTYIRAANRFYYLCAVLDLFARKIVFFKLSDRINAHLIFLLSTLLTSIQSVFISDAETPASRLKQRIIEIICITFDFLSCTYLLNLMCFAIPGIFIFSAFPGHNGYSPRHAKIYHADIVPLSSSPGKPSSS